MRILKLSLILKIDEDLTEIFKVKDKGQFSKEKEILRKTTLSSTIVGLYHSNLLFFVIHRVHKKSSQFVIWP